MEARDNTWLNPLKSTSLYRSDGQVNTATIGINKDDSVILQGTKQNDRVSFVTFGDNGQTPTSRNDVISAYRTGSINAFLIPGYSFLLTGTLQ